VLVVAQTWGYSTREYLFKYVLHGESTKRCYGRKSDHRQSVDGIASELPIRSRF